VIRLKLAILHVTFKQQDFFWLTKNKKDTNKPEIHKNGHVAIDIFENSTKKRPIFKKIEILMHYLFYLIF
jgi:hypothetical protein